MFTSRFQTDLDSIEIFDAAGAAAENGDHVDAMLVKLNPNKQTVQYGRQNGIANRSALPKRRIDKDDEDEDEEDKGVRCLYYALQCCECSIS